MRENSHGIGRAIEACSAIGQSATDPCYIALSQYVGRSSCRGVSDAFVKVLKSKADPAVARLWAKMKAHGCGLRTFVSNYRSSLHVFVESRDLDILMGTNGDWAKGLPQARRMTSRSIACDSLFGFVLDLVGAEGVSEIMETALDVLSPCSASKATIAGIRDAVADELEDHAEAKSLPKSRNVVVQFLGYDLNLSVTGLEFELELRLAARVKAAGLMQRKSGLLRMPHEQWILPALLDEDWETENYVVGAFKAARAFAADIFTAREVCCLADIRKLVMGSASELQKLDPTFVLELGFIEQKLAAVMAKHIEDAVMACLPSEQVAISVQQSDAMIEELMRKDAFLCSERASQSQVEAIREGIAQLKKTLPPAYELWSNDAFFQVALQRLQHFVRVPVNEFGNSTGKELTGGSAVRAKLQWVRAHIDVPEAVNYATFDDFRKFPWLISAGEQRDVRTMVEKVMTRSQRAAGAASSKSQAKRAPKPVAKAEPAAVGCARFF